VIVAYLPRKPSKDSPSNATGPRPTKVGACCGISTTMSILQTKQRVSQTPASDKVDAAVKVWCEAIDRGCLSLADVASEYAGGDVSQVVTWIHEGHGTPPNRANKLAIVPRSVSGGDVVFTSRAAVERMLAQTAGAAA
jgi:hypothetical protein